MYYITIVGINHLYPILEPVHKGGVNALFIAEAPADCLFTACRDSVIRSWNYKNKAVSCLSLGSDGLVINCTSYVLDVVIRLCKFYQNNIH